LPEVQPEPAASPAPVARTYATECTVSANCALDVLLGGGYKPLIATVEAEVADEWQRDGVPLPVAVAAIAEAVKRYRPKGRDKQPRSLRYFDGAVRDAWERSKASSKPKPITDRPPPREPTPEEHLMHLDRLAAAQAERKRGNLSESVGAVLARAGVA
jgi:hypothetical protein